MSGGRQTIGRRAGGALLGLVLLAGCGGGDVPDAGATPTRAGVGEVTAAADGAQEITLQTQDDYVFVPDHFTVDPGTVRLTLVNAAEQTATLTATAGGRAGASVTLSFRVVR